jgi:hypothetical protein
VLSQKCFRKLLKAPGTPKSRCKKKLKNREELPISEAFGNSFVWPLVPFMTTLQSKSHKLGSVFIGVVYKNIFKNVKTISGPTESTDLIF